MGRTSAKMPANCRDSALLEKRSRPVSRVLSWAIIHLRIAVTSNLKRPTREPVRTPARQRTKAHRCSPIWSCSGWGLPCRGVLPPARCALTAPFHPYPRPWALAVYFLWHFPWARAPQALPGTLSAGARTFLPFPEERAIAWPTPGARLGDQSASGKPASR